LDQAACVAQGRRFVGRPEVGERWVLSDHGDQRGVEGGVEDSEGGKLRRMTQVEDERARARPRRQFGNDITLRTGRDGPG